MSEHLSPISEGNDKEAESSYLPVVSEGPPSLTKPKDLPPPPPPPPPVATFSLRPTSLPLSVNSNIPPPSISRGDSGRSGRSGSAPPLPTIPESPGVDPETNQAVSEPVLVREKSSRVPFTSPSDRPASDIPPSRPFSRRTTPSSTGVSPRFKHWATESMNHDVLLDDIEQSDPIGRERDDPAAMGKNEGRKRAGTLAKSLFDGTIAQDSLPTVGGSGSNNPEKELKEYHSLKRRAYLTRFIYFLNAIIPQFGYRLNLYFFALFILSLLAITEALPYPVSAIALFFALCALDMACAIFDHLLFVYVIDVIFVYRFDIAYVLRAFHGPFGMILGLFFAISPISPFGSFRAISGFRDLRRYINAAILILFLICLKDFYVRKHYIKILEERFADKLFQIETWNIILNELASKKPPKGSQKTGAGDENENYFGLYANDPRDNLGTRVLEKLGVVGTGIEKGLAGVGFMKTTVVNVFSELVEATADYDDDDEEEESEDENLVRQLQTTPLKPDDTRRRAKSQQAQDANKKLSRKLRKRKTFWELAARISINSGCLKVTTYGGAITIRRKAQAKDFGRLLYHHLSRHDRYIISHHLLNLIFTNRYSYLPRFFTHGEEEAGEFEYDVESNEELDKGSHHSKGVRSSKSERGKKAENSVAARFSRAFSKTTKSSPNHRGGRHRTGTGNAYQAVLEISASQAEKDLETLLYESAIKLFDPFNLGYITEEQCMAAVCQVYKEFRLAATSLNDYGELHRSLRNVVDFVFWVVIVVILQSFLQVQVYTIFILPFVTMAVTISFALGQPVGAVLLSILFVFFMIPYEIGHKVVIGIDKPRQIVGFVRSISLLYTTIATSSNEVVRYVVLFFRLWFSFLLLPFVSFFSFIFSHLFHRLRSQTISW
jgi:hypothetical protein